MKRTRVVAVVGSFGKSTTTRAVLTALGKPVPPRLGSRWNFKAREVLRIRPGSRHAAIEVGIDGPGQMAVFASLLRPDVAVVTSIGSEHLRELGSLEVTRSEKAAMVRALPPSGLVVLNGDDPNVMWMKTQTRARVVTFGLSDANDLYASAITLEWPHGTHFTLHGGGAAYPVHSRLIGKQMVYPILAAAAVAQAEGMPLHRLIPALETLSPTPGRLQPLRRADGVIILRDDFKAGLETIDVALDVLAEVPAARRIVVLGELSEVRGSRAVIYRPIGERLAAVATLVIFLGGRRNFEHLAAGAEQGGLPRSAVVDVHGSVRQTVAILRDRLAPADVVLVKGRDTQRLERVAFALTGRNVECMVGFCEARVRCDTCPMLERGWAGHRGPRPGCGGRGIRH